MSSGQQEAHKYSHFLVQIIIFLWIIPWVPPGLDFLYTSVSPIWTDSILAGGKRILLMVWNPVVGASPQH